MKILEAYDKGRGELYVFLEGIETAYHYVPGDKSAISLEIAKQKEAGTIKLNPIEKYDEMVSQTQEIRDGEFQVGISNRNKELKNEAAKYGIEVEVTSDNYSMVLEATKYARSKEFFESLTAKTRESTTE